MPGKTAARPQNRAFRLLPRRPEVCRPGSFVRAMFGSGESRSRHSRRPFRDEAANTSLCCFFRWDALGLLAGELLEALHDDRSIFWFALVPPSMTRDAQPPDPQRLVVVEVGSLNASIRGPAFLAYSRTDDVAGPNVITKQALCTAGLADRLPKSPSSRRRGVGTIS